MSEQTPLIETRALKKYFKTSKGVLHAVDDINMKIEKGTTLGMVGESGCGKSTLGRVVLGLIGATSGEIYYKGRDTVKFSKREMRGLRKEMQIIFQDPYASLNPRMSVSEIIAEPLRVNGILRNRREIDRRVKELMDTVGIASRLAYAYPHELDGGRRQRVGIARALSVNPEFIVCDEPVSSLDVSIQAQILNLMMDFQKEMGLTYMFITHDLSVVKHISDEIMVMYLGQCVERAPSKELFAQPKHPYTQALLKAVPIPSLKNRGKPREILPGEVVSPIDPQPGCRFAPRCKYATERCRDPLAFQEISQNHFVACKLYEQAGGEGETR
ncbi:Oligopeptide transport ATP-binding protein OppF [Firmicutes bacterium ASF500]|nr:Oligopeptide transport ATP-binding protein OppF [Firmicutes bacterium ASF500]